MTLIARFDAITAKLLAATGASRATIRLDDDTFGLGVDDVSGEARTEGIVSLRGATAIDQRATATARWLETHRALLVQDDVATSDPRPPEALLRIYGVRSQILAPIERDSALAGWVSLHQVDSPRRWTPQDVEAVRAAAADARIAWDMHRLRTSGG